MLDKGTVGNTSGGVVHHIWLDDGRFYIILNFYKYKGPENAAKFLS
jgi:hypothetical protein